jgi:hypothetical protein
MQRCLIRERPREQGGSSFLVCDLESLKPMLPGGVLAHECGRAPVWAWPGACYALAGWYVTYSTPVLRALDSTSLRLT